MNEPSTQNGPPAAPSPLPYLRLIARVRSRQRRQLWLQGALHGAAAAVLLVTLAGFAGRYSATFGLALLALATLAAAGIPLFLGLVHARKVLGDERRTAWLIGQRVPGVSLDLLAAVELERALGQQPDFSVPLAHAHLEVTNLRAARLDATAAVDLRPVRRAGWGLGAILLFCLVLVMAWPRGWVAGLRVVVAPRTSSTPVAQREPITGDIELTYRYPPYTGLSPRTVVGSNGEVSAPAGTEVLLKTRADREVERAEVVVNGKRLPLQVAGGRELTGSFLLEQAGSYAFVFLSGGGREVARGPDTPVQVQADEPPQVVIQTPGAELEVDPEQEVVLKYEASDDYGVASLELVFRPPGKGEEERVPLPHDEGRRTRGRYTWKLASLKAAPGSRISYRLEAHDNDAVAGKKKGASRTQVLKVYSAAEHRRAAVRKVEALWERMLGHLGDRLEGPDRHPEQEPARVLEHESVDRAGQALVDELRSMALELSRERDAPEEIWAALRHIASELSSRVQRTAGTRRAYLRLQQAGPSAGRRLVQAVHEEIAELEKDILFLELLLDRRKLQDLQELGEELAQQRRELASLIEQYQQTQDPELREAILREIDALKSRMEELLQRMSELARGIRDEHLNAEALQKMMEEQDMGSALEEVERLMREGNAEEALRKLQELATQLEQMLQGLDAAEERMGDAQFPELTRKFEEFSRELKRTTNDQKRVAEETQELKDRTRAQLKERLAAKAQALREQLLEQVEELERSYAQVRAGTLKPAAARSLEETKNELQSVESGLKAEDYDLAADAALRAEHAAGELRAWGNQARSADEALRQPPEKRAESRKLAERLDRNAEGVEEVSRKLQQLFPPPGTGLSEEDRARLRRLAGEQQQLEQRAGGLRRQMEEIEQMAPLFGDEGLEQMGKVGEQMGNAGERMGEGDPSRAHSEQQGALERLGQLQQRMEQQGSKGKGGGLPMPMPSGGRRWGQGLSQEKVELPDEDEYQAPKEFRKDLLDAMKQGAPDRYQEQVKRYYEELVK